METRKEERRFFTSDPKEMLNMYVASQVCRYWEEGNIDDETGEIETIERSELILERGELIDKNTLARLMFHLQSGCIREVEVSNQCRLAFECNEQRLRPYKVTSVVGRKRKSFNLVVLAQSVEKSLKVATDFIELNFDGPYTITSSKSIDEVIVIDEEDSTNVGEKDKKKYYKVSVQAFLKADDPKSGDEQLSSLNFLLKTKDVDSARPIVGERLIDIYAGLNYDTGRIGFIVTTAAFFPCHKIVSKEFCEAYED